MKFCKNLQRVADLSNPEWSPYFTDYKRLKKVIKKLSDLNIGCSEEQSSDSGSHGDQSENSKHLQRHSQTSRDGVEHEEVSPVRHRAVAVEQAHKPTGGSGQTSADCPKQNCGVVGPVATMKRSPGEILFFKLLHFEFQKAVSFFDQVIMEFTIREERIVQSVNIVKQGNRFHLWSTLTKCVYSLHSDLLLLESFCIMTYCSFSKILKKHDKVTGLDTRNAFMSNVVNKANFTNYTKLQEMITRCEDLYSSVSEKMIQEGRQDLDEDERLFVEMVHLMNRQKR